MTLQTQNTYFDQISRNYWNLGVGSAYVMYFNFPLRVNGMVTNGCTNPSNGAIIYGPAYYHENLWTIVCLITSTTLSASTTSNVAQGNARNLRISGFYTPYYYLQAS